MSPSYSPNTSLAEEPFAVSVRGAPQTSTRLPAVSADTVWGRAAVPRANTTGNGAYTEKYKDYTVLQQHVLFWDRDMDGVIYPWHTYAGFRDLGFNMLFSALAMVIIHMGFSYPTRLQYSYLPDPLWGVYVGGIHKAKHGSDSETYDSEGRFRPQQFEDMFAKYARENCGYLTLGELFDLMKGNRNAVDPFGVSWCLSWDRDDMLILDITVVRGGL